jgi:site-specific recombinase XerD
MAHFNIDKKFRTIYIVQWLPSNKRLPISTRIQLNDLSEWDEEKEQPVDINQKDKKGVKIVDTLARYRSAMAAAVKECEVTHKDLKQTFKSKLSGEIIRGGPLAVKQVKFLDFFETIVKEYEGSPGQSNCKSYRTTLKNLQTYFGKKNPSFAEIDLLFFDKFTTYMKKEPLEYAMNTIHCQWKNIKAIINKARKIYKYEVNQDYKEFLVDTEDSSNIFLTLDELDAIYNLDLVDEPHLDKTRDYFIIGAFTGLRYGDWDRVSNDIIEDGVFKIDANKTGEDCLIPIHRYVQAILDKYKGTLPKKIENQPMNDNLKIIGERAKLNKVTEKKITKGTANTKTRTKLEKWERLVTHTARRSFCTNCILQGANPYEVKLISGHTSLESFDKYIKMSSLMALDGLKKLKMFQPVPKKRQKKEPAKKSIKS